MHRFVHLLVAGAVLLPAGCATPGGGPLGFVALDPNHHVAAAEPLIARNEEQCLNDSGFLSLVLDPATATAAQPKAACDLLAWQAAKAVHRQGGGPDTADAQKLRRNIMIDSMLAASEAKCASYKEFVQMYDGNVNTTFGILAQAAAIAATLATGGAAQGLAAGAALASGSRGTLNNAHFSDKTVGFLIKAIDAARQTKYSAIKQRQKSDSVIDYTVVSGIRDAFEYHANCSVVQGLQEATRAVEQAHAPSMETLKKLFDDYWATRKAIEGGNTVAENVVRATANSAGQ